MATAIENRRAAEIGVVVQSAPPPADPGGAPASSRKRGLIGRRTPRGRAIFAGGAACAATAVAVRLLTVPFGHAGWGDSFIYTGYIVDYATNVERFGRPYYSTRISSIWPAELGYRLLGEFGDWLVHTIALFALLAAVAAAARWRYGAKASVIATSAVASSAWVIDSFIDDYTQYSALTYATISLAALAIGGRRIAGAALCGVFAALAINSYPVVVLSLGPILLAAGAVALARGETRALLRGAAGFAVGLLAGEAILGAAMALRFGWSTETLLFERQTFSEMVWLTTGGQRPFAVPLLNSLFPLILLPVIAALVTTAVLVVAARRRLHDRAMAWTAMISVNLVVSAEVVGHLGLGSGLLGFPFLVAMLIPAFIAGLIVVVGESSASLNLGRRATVVVATAPPMVAFAMTRTTAADAWFIALSLTAIGACLLSASMALVSDLGDQTRPLPWFWGTALPAFVILSTATPLASGAALERMAPLPSAGGIRANYRATMSSSARAEDAAIHGIATDFVELVNREIPTASTTSFSYPPTHPWLVSVWFTTVAGAVTGRSRGCLGCDDPAKWPAAIAGREANAESQDYFVVLSPDADQAERVDRLIRTSLPMFTRVSSERLGTEEVSAWVRIYRKDPRTRHTRPGRR